jgi:excisionase family DNA binding protein
LPQKSNANMLPGNGAKSETGKPLAKWQKEYRSPSLPCGGRESLLRVFDLRVQQPAIASIHKRRQRCLTHENLRNVLVERFLKSRFLAKSRKELFPMSTTSDAPKLTYSIPETCKVLQISRTTLWKLVKSRRLKPLRIGRRVLFTTRALEEFLIGDRTARR